MASRAVVVMFAGAFAVKKEFGERALTDAQIRMAHAGMVRVVALGIRRRGGWGLAGGAAGAVTGGSMHALLSGPK
jgi:hypothetical protein